MPNLLKAIKTVPSKPEEGFDSKIAKEGRDKGYELGQKIIKIH